MFERLRHGLHQVLHHGRAREDEPAPQGLESSEAHLIIRQHDDRIELQPTFVADPMLSFRGRLAGPLSTARIASRSSTTMLRLQFAVRADGQEHGVEIMVMRAGQAHDNDAHPGEGYTLARARRRRIPPDQQAVEVLYSNVDDRQIRYLVAMTSRLQAVEFKEFARHETIFREVPSVSQMVAFLRATLHHRRTTLRSLESMAHNTALSHVRVMVDDMTRRLSQGQDFTTEALGDALASAVAQGQSPNPNTLAALALLSDIFLENLRGTHLDALVERGEELPVSSSALAAALAFLGGDVASLPATLQGEAAMVGRALAFLQTTVARRNALSILTDLADDSGSERSRVRVDHLRARVAAEQNLCNDEHLALQSYIEGRGRRLQAETISALAIYVDFEAGILNEEDIDGLTPQRGFVDASLYSMVAIARAFDYDLRCWLLPFIRSHDPLEHDEMWQQLADLVGLSDGGVIARFFEAGQPGHQTMHVATTDQVAVFRARGYEFSGEFLADLPTLHHLQEVELGAFEALGTPIIARFMSENGGVQWRRLDGVRQAPNTALRELLKRPYSFIDRYEVFHFAHNVLGRHQSVQADALVGRDNVLVVYLDARGAAHYKYLSRINAADEVTTPPQRDWEWAGAVVRFADASRFPRYLTEASHDYLLGLPEDRTSLGRLDLVYNGLERSLVPHLPAVGLDGPLLETLLEVMQSDAFRALLPGIVDREAALAWLDAHRGRLLLSSAMADACTCAPLQEVASLLILHDLPSLGEASPRDADRFDALVLDRLLAAVESGEGEVQRRAVRLMGTHATHARKEQRLAFSYVLSRLMDHDVSEVSRGAACALGTIALRRIHPPPRLIACDDAPPRSTDAGSTDVDATAAEVVAIFSLPPEHHKAVVTMLAGLLAET